jgi:pilus assembly protein CpaE
MHGVAVAVLSEDRERVSILQQRTEATQMGRTVFAHTGFPTAATDSVLRQIQDHRSEVVLVDIDPENLQRAIQAIELIHGTTSDIVVFAVGDMHHPATIVAAMRAGAREFLEQHVSSEALIDAFTRFTSSRSKTRNTAGRARVFSVINSKGGAGATTVAVNTAVALQETHGSALLVDFAPLGHAALHLNVRPSFGLADALQNLHRMDTSLLDGLLTQCKGGLQLLAGPQQPFPAAPTAAELARLFDILVMHFRHVVVDCSNRIDHTGRLLCDLSNAVLLVSQTDVVSLWSAGRLRTYLADSSESDRVRVVLNRYKRIPGFNDEDVEKATNCKLLWKVPNDYQAVGPAIDKGAPVVFQSSEEISRSFRALADTLAGASGSEGTLDLVYQQDKSDPKKKASRRLIISPLRAGQ